MLADFSARSTVKGLLKAPFGLAIVLGVLGLPLAVGGAWLLTLGGSPYYSAAGLALSTAAVLTLMRRQAACWVYVVFLIMTVGWALLEAGFDFWGLLPRIAVPGALGLWFSMPWVGRSLRLSMRGRLIALLLSAGTGTLLGSAYLASGLHEVAERDFPGVRVGHGAPWQSYGGDAGGQRFAAFDQINRKNVEKLDVAWTFRTGHNDSVGGQPPRPFTFEATPLQVGTDLILCTPHNVVISVDGDSGKERWRFDPRTDLSKAATLVCRGVAYSARAGSAPCSQSILTSTLDNRLIALDAKTGALCAGFGRDGIVDLSVGMGPSMPQYQTVTSAPTIVNGVAIVGSFGLDNQMVNQPSGAVRGYDVIDGRLIWAWDVLHPKAIGSLAPGHSYPPGTPNSWGVASADAALGLVYIPTGATTPDLFGGERTAQQDRYATSIVALDVRTGDVRWSFQTVHHDIWDYDVGSQPVLVDWPTGGGSVPALLAPGKRGEIFVLDRRTGRPLLPVTEKHVPRSTTPGERASPTQPFQSGFPSFAPPRLRESSMWGVTPIDQMMCRIAFRRHRYDGLFTPPSLEGSIVHPGSLGVFNWGSVSVDPERQLMVANTNWLPYVLGLVPRKRADALGVRPFGKNNPTPFVLERGAWIMAQKGTPYAGSLKPFLSILGIPCNQPPWGHISVVDLRSRKRLWQRPFGTTRDVAPLGLALPAGVMNIGGSVTTRGGLTFIGASIDDYIRAYATDTGAELWRKRLPAGGQATPMTFVSPRTGRQYVVIAAGGHASFGTKAGDSLVAYALPPG